MVTEPSAPPQSESARPAAPPSPAPASPRKPGLTGIVIWSVFSLLVLAVGTYIPAAWLGLIPLPTDGPWDAASIAESKERGHLIASGLDAYVRMRGEFPARLEDLGPSFDARLKPPSAGTRTWHYVPGPANYTYELSFGKRGPGGLSPRYVITNDDPHTWREEK